ncbi:MAG: hypothetical protein AAGI52_09835 [Bacteroidota bacterium]
MSRRVNVFIVVLTALILIRMVMDGFTAELFDGTVLLESAFFAALASYLSGMSCAATTCHPSSS